MTKGKSATIIFIERHSLAFQSRKKTRYIFYSLICLSRYPQTPQHCPLSTPCFLWKSVQVVYESFRKRVRLLSHYHSIKSKMSLSLLYVFQETVYLTKRNTYMVTLIPIRTTFFYCKHSINIWKRCKFKTRVNFTYFLKGIRFLLKKISKINEANYFLKSKKKNLDLYDVETLEALFFFDSTPFR